MKYIFTIWLCLNGHPQHCEFTYRDEMQGDYRECLDAAKGMINEHVIADNKHAEYACKAEEQEL